LGAIRTFRSFAASLPPVLGLTAWVVAAALAARSVPDALSQHPGVARLAVYAIASVTGLGGLVGFWYSIASIQFFVRGYRIRSPSRTQWVYEERAADGSVEGLSLRELRLLGAAYGLAPISCHCGDSVRTEL
jgi:hypothetical protein